MTEEQKAVIAELKGDPELKELLKDVIPTDDLTSLKSALQKEREARKTFEREKLELEKAKEAETAKALEEQGKFKELYDKVIKENEGLKVLSTYKDKYETLVEMTKTELLEKLPEDKREVYKSFDLDVLRVVVKDIVQVQAKKTSPGAEGAGTGQITADSKWSELSEEARITLHSQNPTLAQKLMEADYIRQRY